MSIVVSFKKKMIQIVEDDKCEYIVIDEDVDPGEVDDEDLFRYKKVTEVRGD